MKTINVFGFHSHLGNDSRPSAFKTFIDPLKKHLKVNVFPIDNASINQFNYDSLIGSPIVFWAIHPNSKLFLHVKHNITWVPMYDDVLWQSKNWWRKISKRVKIISYSDSIYKKIKHFDHKAIKVKYFEDPANFKKCSWNKGINIFYWNRSGLLTKKQIELICLKTKAKTLVFRNHLDYYAHHSQNISLNGKTGLTKIISLDNNTSYEKYLSALSKCNVFFSPRLYEGIGLTNLEAMASGMAVFSPSNPTMSEYIKHNSNGILLNYNNSIRHYNRFITKLGKLFKINLDPLPVLLNNSRIKNINLNLLEKIGNKAREDHKVGYRNWENTVPKIVKFIFEK